MKTVLTLLCYLVLGISTYAQKIKLVKDINYLGGNSSPTFLAVREDRSMFFIGDDGVHGRELWISDGTEQGTKMLKDVFPGSRNGIRNIASKYFNGKLYFIGKDSLHGEELWVSDGTATGTNMLKEINPTDTNNLGTQNMVNYNGKLYFTAKTTTAGAELWCTDGTTTGTKMVKDIYKGASDSYPMSLTVGLGKLFFFAKDDTFGHELWVTNGTDTGTHIVQDLYPGIKSGTSGEIELYNNHIYFEGSTDSITGRELYRYNGTIIELVKNIDTANGKSSNIREMKAIAGKLYFTASDGTHGYELWVCDGVQTYMLKDFQMGAQSSSHQILGEIYNKLIFSADDGIHGSELWVSDGTDTGTYMVKNISSSWGVKHQPSAKLYNDNIIAGSVTFNNVLYFSGYSFSYGEELWRSDGTDTGTYIVEDFGKYPDAGASSMLYSIYVDSNRIWLQMNDGYYGSEPYLYNLYDTTTSVSKIDAHSQVFTIYPNPNNGSFTIALDDNSFINGTLQIYDVTGKDIYSEKIGNAKKHITVGLGNVPAGVYQIKVTLDKRVSTRAVTIK